jgi:hypothetical protein
VKLDKNLTKTSQTAHQSSRESSMVNILLFFILASYLGGIIIPLPTLSRPGRGLQQKGKRNHFQRRLSSSAALKVHENAQNFF